MNTFEIIITFLSSSIFLALMGMFYRLGSFHTELALNFKAIDVRFKAIDDRLSSIELDIKEIRRDITRMDKDIAVITATLRFNGFDLERHKVEGEL